jgi:hypothetical protein
MNIKMKTQCSLRTHTINTILFLITQISFAQIGIGTNSPKQSAALEIVSDSKGLLIPRVALTSTTDNVTILSPTESLLVYNTNLINDVTPGFYYWNSVWIPLKTTIAPSSGTNWSLGGNTISSSDFIGSVNYNPLQFRINNIAFGKFHPGGGIAIGAGATANDNNAIAIGTNANATANNQATAIGPSANASGYQSTAVGYQSYTSNNSTLALGKSAQATAFQATALGTDAIANAQNATAIGYAATASQSNAIILGNSSNVNNKVGIGTNTPDERLHIVGSFKMVDGNQQEGNILVSDAVGKARWQNPETSARFGNIYYNGSGQALNEYANVTFDSTNEIKNVTVNSDGITVTNAGVYKISYTVCMTKNAGAAITPVFSLYKNYSTPLNGSKSSASLGNNQTVTLHNTVIIQLNAYDKVSVRSLISDGNTYITSNGTSMSIEKVF